MERDHEAAADDVDPAVTRLAEEIRVRRKAAGLSHAQLAARVGYSRQYLSMAERPTRGLASADLVRALDNALAAEGALIGLRAAAAHARARRHQADRIALRHVPAPVPAAVDGVRAVAAESVSFARRHGGHGLHEAVLEQFDAEVLRLAEEFLHEPPAAVAGRCRAVRDELFGLLEQPRWPQQARRLYALAARTCGYLAVAASDFFGQYTAAADHARTAWQLAELADHDELRCWIRSVQSANAFWAGHWHLAADLAHQAQHLAVTRSGAARAAAMRARVLARLGDTTGLHHTAQTALPEHTSAGETGIVLFTDANHRRCLGGAYLQAGEHDTARTHLEHALAAYQRERPHDYAVITVTRLDLAAAHLASGDLPAAMAATRPVLAVPHTHRLQGALRRMRHLRTVLDEPRHLAQPAARAWAEELDAFAAHTALAG